MSDQSFALPSSNENSVATDVLSSRIDCGAQLAISSIAPLAAQLNQALTDGRATVLMCADVSQVDTAGLQTLLAFMQDAAGKKMHVQWDAPSEILQQSVLLLGMNAQLGI